MYQRAIICLILFLNYSSGYGNSWDQAQTIKKANISIYWYTSNPFIYKDSKQNLTGLEYEIIDAFKDFLKSKHNIDINIQWTEADSFYNILERVQQSDQTCFGVSAFSITEERQKLVRYTNSYLPDITVLISSQGTPIVRSYEEFDKLVSELEAVTIKGTIYEPLLEKLQSQLKNSFDINYISSDQNVLDIISEADNRFGFIDLPIYLMTIKKGSELTRQNFFTVKGLGYGFIMPKHSDWNVPFNEFLSDPTYKHQVAQIISKYLGTELYEIIDNLFEGEPLGTSILTKEKEIQLALIQNANLRLAEEKEFKRLLIFGMAISMLFLFVIGFLFLNNQKTTKLLLSQNQQIEKQQNAINLKNGQLMNRNSQLLALNEEKNNLVRILAHDLRSPVNNIIGLANILETSEKDISNTNKQLLTHISDGAGQLNQMITKILNPESLNGDSKLVLKEEVDIRQVMNDISSRYRPIAAKKNIQLEIFHCNENVVISTDHLLLFLILENLVSNAVKFSPANTTVTLESVCNTEEVVFKIMDQGPGFTDSDKELMFNRFQKLSAQPTANESSTGLGLSIVKKYVGDLGAKVWLESESGNGSTFYISIPIK